MGCSPTTPACTITGRASPARRLTCCGQRSKCQGSKRLPSARQPQPQAPAPGTNRLALEGSSTQLGGDPGAPDSASSPARAGPRPERLHQRSSSVSSADQWSEAAALTPASGPAETWHFEASMAEERELWVQSVQAQILASLQGCRSAKDKTRLGNQNAALAVQAVRTVRGNSFCIDCDAPSECRACGARQLLRAVVEGDLRLLVMLLARGSKEEVNESYGVGDGRTALHLSSAVAKVVFTQLLICYRVDVRSRDARA
ncbi:hypothetical protein CB1_000347015 [Camelus ferus]|nr:hypothetical protein CB1_000347015 [Camelus ferus]